jgi:hypothetical protein
MDFVFFVPILAAAAIAFFLGRASRSIWRVTGLGAFSSAVLGAFVFLLTRPSPCPRFGCVRTPTMYPWRDTLERIIETPLIVVSKLLHGAAPEIGENLSIKAFRWARPDPWYHTDLRSIVVEAATAGMTFLLMGIVAALIGYALGSKMTTKSKVFLVIACLFGLGFFGQSAYFKDHAGNASDRLRDRVQETICEGERASGVDPGPGCADYRQPSPVISLDEKAIRQQRFGEKVQRGCLEQINRAGLTDQQITDYCNCFADDMAKVVTIDEVDIDQNDEPSESLKRKIIKSTTSCRAIHLKTDGIAVKNIHMISAALILGNCSNFQINRSRIAEYARQNGVDIEAVKADSHKYERQKRYAIEIVKAHAKISPASLCAAIIQDFGPQGKLAVGLVTEK